MFKIKFFLILTILYTCGNTISAENKDVTTEEFLLTELRKDTTIPLLSITTVNGEIPTFDYVSAPQGCIGASITNATKVPNRTVITLAGDTLYDSGSYIKNISGATIKIRGNTSAYNRKRPYKLKLQKKADLLCRTDTTIDYSDDDWILIHTKENLLKTEIGFMFNKLLNLQWTPSCRYVNVLLNGEYKGIYLLSESVERNADCRINVDKNSGFLFEYDPYWWNEDFYIKSRFYLNWTFKYPDSKDLTLAQTDYFERTINLMEKSLRDGTYPEYIDVASFASWCLAHDFLGTEDGGGSNVYLTKFDSTSQTKIKMGCLWDFDAIGRRADKWATVHSWDGSFFYLLFNSINPDFVNNYIRLWEEQGDYIHSELSNWFDQYENSALAHSLEKYLTYDTQVSHINYETINEQIDIMRNWFDTRHIWLDDAVEDLKIKSNITLQESNKSNNNQSILYDMSGRQVVQPSKGIYIKGNKKVIIR